MSDKRRIHTFGIPHLPTTKEYNSCAYTQKQIKFCKMMRARGHHVIFYGHDASEVDCDELVPVSDDKVLEQAYGGYDWKKQQFKHNVADYAYTTFNQRAGPELLKRVSAKDFVHCPFGYAHQFIAQNAEKQGAIVVEGGIGYTTGHFARWRAYESHAVRNAVEGRINPQNWYSWVIPNYFDPADFDYCQDKEDYILYLGRITELKGITTCIKATQAAGVRLKIAGQGDLSSLGWHTLPSNVELVGYADVETRRQLMSKAKALIIATTYLEPFGGVVVEALLSGTPIITPFFGAFAEINHHGQTGFLCHNLQDFYNAIQSIEHIKPIDCRQQGLKYTLDEVAPQFENWFTAIDRCYTTKEGWNYLG